MDVEGLPHVSHRNTLRAAAGALTFRHGATLNLRLLDCHPGKTLSTVKNSARSARGNRKLMRKTRVY
jgi:hypothetical protein